MQLRQREWKFYYSTFYISKISSSCYESSYAHIYLILKLFTRRYLLRIIINKINVNNNSTIILLYRYSLRDYYTIAKNLDN